MAASRHHRLGRGHGHRHPCRVRTARHARRGFLRRRLLRRCDPPDPAGPAFSIWSLIYVGLIAFVIWQWFHPGSERATRITWLTAASMILNAIWLGVTQVGWLWPSVVVILTLAVVLGLLLRCLGESRPTSTLEAVVVDGTFGVYLGWVAVASVANVTAVLVASGVDPGEGVATVLAVVVLAVAVALGAVFALALAARWTVAAAMAWALAWIAVGRLTSGPASVTVAVAAVVSALAILAVTAYARHRHAGGTTRVPANAPDGRVHA
nr:TspO/MBR family protein [Tessaracoccus defluvii]